MEVTEPNGKGQDRAKRRPAPAASRASSDAGVQPEGGCPSPTGAKLPEIKTSPIQPEDKGILFDILDKLGVTGEQLAAMPTTEVARLLAGPEPQRMEPPKPKSKPLSDVIALYLTEKKLDNVAKTLEDKERTFTEFQGFFQDSDINAFDADTAIAYKNRLLAANASASRINAKTSFLRDLFAYAINNTH